MDCDHTQHANLPDPAQAALDDMRAYVDTLTLPEALAASTCVLTNLGLSSGTPTLMAKLRAGVGQGPLPEPHRSNHHAFLVAVLHMLMERTTALTGSVPDHAICRDFIPTMGRADQTLVDALRRATGGDA